jgi:phosphatidylethanolamine/phosphatidyl-N-methylethanolamine N-methyltransferase
MSGRPHDYWLFFRQFRHRFHTTGAILPSNRGLGKALAQFVGVSSQPQRILEVGPGTGAVTRCIAAAMGPEDRLDLVEINAQFVHHLQRILAEDRALEQVAPRITVVHQSVTDFTSPFTYDLIISGLPLNNFEVAEVEAILAAFARLTRSGGTVSFFEYMGLRRARLHLSGRRQRARLAGIDQALGQLIAEHEVRRNSIWLNVPPAWVHHVRMTDTGLQSPSNSVEGKGS